MKTLNSIAASITATALLSALSVLWITNSALAQEKGAERLVKMQQASAPPALAKGQVASSVSMTCAKCKDTFVTVAEPPGRGGRPATAVVAEHQCPTCATRIETIGVGKQATTAVKHLCSESGTHACAMTKASHRPDNVN
jgi:hypothetical protein